MVSMILCSVWFLLVYRRISDLCALILYPVTLQHGFKFKHCICVEIEILIGGRKWVRSYGGVASMEWDKGKQENNGKGAGRLNGVGFGRAGQRSEYGKEEITVRTISKCCIEMYYCRIFIKCTCMHVQKEFKQSYPILGNHTPPRYHRLSNEYLPANGLLLFIFLISGQ